jgi:hypothetical protein
MNNEYGFFHLPFLYQIHQTPLFAILDPYAPDSKMKKDPLQVPWRSRIPHRPEGMSLGHHNDQEGTADDRGTDLDQTVSGRKSMVTAEKDSEPEKTCKSLTGRKVAFFRLFR